VFDNQGRLNIFEDFRVDRDLPKFQPTDLDQLQSIRLGDSDSEMMSHDQFERRASIRSRRSGRLSITATNTTLMVSGADVGPRVRLTWPQRILFWILRWMSPEGDNLMLSTEKPDGWPVTPPEITVHEFFSSIKDSQADLEVVDGRARGYEAALERARQTGQKALAEQLEAGIEAVRAETQLHAMGLTRVLTEETLVDFVKKSPRGLRLDWIRNFTRVVPDDVLTAKVECDKRGIFDNYVVLHYDPEAKSWAETEAEKNARKDPILFGVVEGRRVLYFVGEWVDEYCDLSLDQIADVLFEGMDVRPSEATDRLDSEVFVHG
jgi:hypothetical protein